MFWQFWESFFLSAQKTQKNLLSEDGVWDFVTAVATFTKNLGTADKEVLQGPQLQAGVTTDTQQNKLDGLGRTLWAPLKY